MTAALHQATGTVIAPLGLAELPSAPGQLHLPLCAWAPQRPGGKLSPEETSHGLHTGLAQGPEQAEGWGMEDGRSGLSGHDSQSPSL